MMLRKTVTVLFVLGLVLLLAYSLQDSSRARSDLLPALSQKFDIRVVHEDIGFPVRTFHGVISGREAGASDLGTYTPILAAEFDLYPVSFVKRSRLRKIVLCRDLAFNGQRRGALPDFADDVLYLDVCTGSYSELYQRRVIHHEFFHIVDYQDDGKVYSDPQWAKINREGFAYGDGGINMQDNPNASLLTRSYPGFLTEYSTAGVEEDKAEIFAHMMVNLDIVEARAEEDAVIRSKVKFMRKLTRQFTGDCDDDFWSRIRKRSLPAR